MTEIAKARPHQTTQALSLLINYRQRSFNNASSEEFLQLLSRKTGKLEQQRTSTQNPEAKLRDNYANQLFKAISQAPHRKAPGLDGIVGEAIQTHPKQATTIITAALADIIETGRLTNDLSSAIITMLPKGSPNSTNANDYKPVVCQSHIRKLIEKPIAQHIQGVWEIAEGQHGYSSGTSAEIAIQIIHDQLRSNHQLRLITLDLSGAFDRAPTKILCEQIAKLKATKMWNRLATVFAENSTHY